jgi:DNA-binding response OmpR family regulator
MRILVVEDEEKVASFIKKGLEQSAYTVDWAPTGREGIDHARATQYDAILMDLMLPDTDGLEVVRQLRQQGITAPILALTARGGLDDRVAGLDSGCDDYLAKPFAFDELLARLRALLRRASSQKTAVMEFGGIVMDPVTRRVSRENKSIELTNKEYALLEMLMRHPGQVFTRTAIMESVWGYDFDNSSNVLEVYINFLRKKIDQSFGKKLLHTVRGVGYVLREEP